MNKALIEALRIDAANLENGLKWQEQEAQNREKERLETEYFARVSSANQMLTKVYTEEDTLLEPILPRQGVVALVGSSDSGKSSLLRGLAMAIVAGKSEYIGFALHPRYRRAMYISTEDDEASLSRLSSSKTFLLPNPTSISNTRDGACKAHLGTAAGAAPPEPPRSLLPCVRAYFRPGPATHHQNTERNKW